MPRKPDAVAIGRINCLKPGCGQRAAVYQSRRDYLYVRCPKCGCDQSNGPDDQVAWWQHLEPTGATDANGVPVLIRRPRNVPESAGAMGCALGDIAPEPVVIEPAEPVQAAGAEPVQEGAAAVPENTGKTPAKTEKAPEHTGAGVPAEKPVPAPMGNKPRRGGALVFWGLLGLIATGVGIVVKAAAENSQGAA